MAKDRSYKSRATTAANHARKRTSPKKKPAAKKQTKAQVKRVLTDGPVRRRPLKQPPLPGTEQIRNLQLDALCESIADHRTAMNDAKNGEKADSATAIRVMHDSDTRAYTHAGVTLVLVPGKAEELKIRWKRDSKTATGTENDGSDDVDAMDEDDDESGAGLESDEAADLQ